MRNSRQERGPSEGQRWDLVSSWFITMAPDFTKEKGGKPCWFLIKALRLCPFTLGAGGGGLLIS